MRALSFIAAAGGGGSSAAYTNFAARCTSAGASLTGSDATNYGTLLDGLTTDGLFASDGTTTKLDFLYILAAPSATVALLDLTNRAANATAQGSPTFTAYQGYLGVDASTTVYLDTGFNATSASSPNFTQNAAHIGAWSNTNVQAVSGGAVIGSIGTENTFIFPKFSDGKAYYRINDNAAGGSAGITNANSTGYYVANRSGASAQQGYKNATDQSVTAVASASIQNQKIFILAYDGVGSTASFGGAYQISAAHAGGSLTQTDVTNLNSRIGVYRTAVGL